MVGSDTDDSDENGGGGGCGCREGDENDRKDDRVAPCPVIRMRKDGNFIIVTPQDNPFDSDAICNIPATHLNDLTICLLDDATYKERSAENVEALSVLTYMSSQTVAARSETRRTSVSHSRDGRPGSLQMSCRGGLCSDCPGTTSSSSDGFGGI